MRAGRDLDYQDGEPSKYWEVLPGAGHWSAIEATWSKYGFKLVGFFLVPFIIFPGSKKFQFADIRSHSPGVHTEQRSLHCNRLLCQVSL